MSRALSDKTAVYAYEFSDRTAPSYVGPTTFPMLAAHTYELSYVFPGFRGVGNVQVELNPMLEKLSDQMVNYFTNGAKLASTDHAWTRYDPDTDNVMTFIVPEATWCSAGFPRRISVGFGISQVLTRYHRFCSSFRRFSQGLRLRITRINLIRRAPGPPLSLIT